MEIINLIADNELPEHSALVAAIDVGSNAMRLGIAMQDSSGTATLIQRYREPVRLGHDAFTSGVFSEQTMEDAIEAFRQFRRILDQHHIERFRATATSAMRDSKNGKLLAKRIREETDIDLQLISGEEEARLVHYSITRRADLSSKLAVLIDMGGGSVEVTLCDDGEAISAQSFKIGTVRLLEMLGQEGDFNTLLSEYLDGTRKKIREQIGRSKADICVATGGNASAIGELAFQILSTESATSISRKQLKKLIKKLSRLSFEERIRDYGLRPDRADVILPAAMVFHEIMLLSGAKEMVMPDASLLDGIVLDMVDSEDQTFHSQRRNLIAWARSLKSKYHVDRKYAKEVADLALTLFDQSRDLHALNHRDRLLLEIAALVHEIGMYVRVGGHHHHAAYLISVAPLLGLSDNEKATLTQLVRYQRKAAPSDTHNGFAELSKSAQLKVWQLSAILRLAIALNKERRNRISTLMMEIGEETLSLHMEGKGDMLLERWAALQTADYFEQAFGLQLHIDLAQEVLQPQG
ncbi:exopolyphosphatase [Mariprofundus ferrinatatus]|uniref:Exopolyphosphatase n=1 Tax=Mariprofundus ferrinatatus TaxID=1921087 RepID=A0A2K8L2E8_9PROT|nr:Ppx/GppA phosphatase family protein [Mariprofundus ferrinatatus]ATX81495.1 exopolyphosphatase [Mariprofundus ferrinatatus]